jgi:hypothetical protein
MIAHFPASEWGQRVRAGLRQLRLPDVVTAPGVPVTDDVVTPDAFGAPRGGETEVSGCSSCSSS